MYYSKLTFNLEKVIGRQNWFIPCDPLTYPRFFFQKVTVLLERKSIKKSNVNLVKEEKEKYENKRESYNRIFFYLHISTVIHFLVPYLISKCIPLELP